MFFKAVLTDVNKIVIPTKQSHDLCCIKQQLLVLDTSRHI